MLTSMREGVEPAGGHRGGTGKRAGGQAGRAGAMDANTESASSRKWSFLSAVNVSSSRWELNVAPGD